MCMQSTSLHLWEVALAKHLIAQASKLKQDQLHSLPGPGQNDDVEPQPGSGKAMPPPTGLSLQPTEEGYPKGQQSLC